MRDWTFSKAGLVFGALVCLQASAAIAGPPPQELRGKSITLTWSESRESRPFGEGGDWRRSTTGFKVQIYVGETGRMFLDGRLNNPGGEASGKTLVGSSGKSIAGNFSGRSMSLVHRGTGNIARQLTFDFDPSFQNCTARVQFARLSTSGITRDYDPVKKTFWEVKSLETSGAQCGVQAGNVFSGR